jgi:transposase-like protein
VSAYPDCPTCRSDVFVERSKGTDEYVCQSCRSTFDAPASFRSARDRRGDA